MKIPIQNVYYLLCYAWDALDARDTVDLDVEGEGPAAELCARLLLAGFAHITRRGVARQYRAVTEHVDGVRGKLQLSNTVKFNLLARARSSCEFDDLTHDILPNRIIKATMQALLAISGLDHEVQDLLASALRQLRDVGTITLRTRAFREVQSSRLSGPYVLAMHICQLVYENLLVDEHAGTHRFRDFLRDDRQMSRLFQRFVCNFFKREQTEYRVSSPWVRWRDVAGGQRELDHLPIMQTDIVLHSARRTIIIDTKFYREAFASRYGDRKLHAEHLYQIYAYLQNWPVAGGDTRLVSGVLLYPVVRDEFLLDYQFGRYDLRVASINLNRPWQDIHNALRAIVSFDLASSG